VDICCKSGYSEVCSFFVFDSRLDIIHVFSPVAVGICRYIVVAF
jgi:hypothetical protein